MHLYLVMPAGPYQKEAELGMSPFPLLKDFLLAVSSG